MCAAISAVERPPGAFMKPSSQSSISSTVGGAIRSVRSITRNLSPISTNSGEDSPALVQAVVIRCIPLPHCSISPNSLVWARIGLA
jgi:hypothetical protein